MEPSRAPKPGMDLLGTQLVVVPMACESGRGDVVSGQGAGTGSAFLQAGADPVLATPFPVDDRLSTATFMRLF